MKRLEKFRKRYKRLKSKNCNEHQNSPLPTKKGSEDDESRFTGGKVAIKIVIYSVKAAYRELRLGITKGKNNHIQSFGRKN